MKAGDLLELSIESLAAGGMGLGRHESFVIFVPLSAPGDKLQVRLTKVKKSHAFASIEKLIEPGPDRLEAPCPYFSRCGGCDWMHLSYEAQLKAKQEIVANHLRHLWTGDIPITSSPQEFRYRNRIQLKVRDKKVGYFAKGSHDLVEIDDCLIAEEKLAEKIKALKIDPPQDDQSIDLRLSESDEVLSQSLRKQEIGEDFSQVNRFVNPLMVERALELCPDHNFSVIWDLYAGSGNFSFPLKARYQEAEVYAIEASQQAIARAHQKNLERPETEKVQFYNSSVERFLERYQLPDEGMILLDPPRTGLSPYALSMIQAQSPHQIIYISCNPATLSRDLAALTEQTGLKLQKLEAFDMFPQTSHVEVLSLLGK